MYKQAISRKIELERSLEIVGRTCPTRGRSEKEVREELRAHLKDILYPEELERMPQFQKRLSSNGPDTQKEQNQKLQEQLHQFIDREKEAERTAKDSYYKLPDSHFGGKLHS